jgi:hypothetical protein
MDSQQYLQNYELTTQPQSFDQCLVTISVPLLEIIEQLPALAYQAQQATTGVMVLLVLHEMGGQMVDASG